MSRIHRRSAVLAATVVAAAVAPGAMAQTPSAPPVARDFDGKVVSVAKQKRTFRMRTESGRIVRVKVTRSTRFERIAGFAGLAKGQVIDVTARRRDGRWVALEVERDRPDGRDDDGPRDDRDHN